MNDEFLNRVGGERISNRQIDELIGLSRGLVADNQINQAEVEFLQKWLAINVSVSGHALINKLYHRINEILADGIVDDDEKAELLDTLNRFSNRDFELGESMKSTSLPLCTPLPKVSFTGQRYCFTGTFTYGRRKDCEQAAIDRGATAGSITQKTNILVIGTYATESWKHSSFGNKILQAVEWRDQGFPIAIISEDYWVHHL